METTYHKNYTQTKRMDQFINLRYRKRAHTYSKCISQAREENPNKMWMMGSADQLFLLVESWTRISMSLLVELWSTMIKILCLKFSWLQEHISYMLKSILLELWKLYPRSAQLVYILRISPDYSLRIRTSTQTFWKSYSWITQDRTNDKLIMMDKCGLLGNCSTKRVATLT